MGENADDMIFGEIGMTIDASFGKKKAKDVAARQNGRFPIDNELASGANSSTITWEPGPKTTGPFAAAVLILGTKAKTPSTRWLPVC